MFGFTAQYESSPRNVILANVNNFVINNESNGTIKKLDVKK